jgi:hypothetical protein
VYKKDWVLPFLEERQKQSFSAQVALLEEGLKNASTYDLVDPMKLALVASCS